MYYNLIQPDIDPVFANLNKTIMDIGYARDGCMDNIIDVNSVKCVVKDESKGWKSVVLEVNASFARLGQYLTISCLDKDGRVIKYSGNGYESMYIQTVITGEPNQTVEIPLRSVSPEDIYTIRVQ